MAIFTVNYSGDYGHYYEFKAEAWESDVNNLANTSKVNVDIYLRRNKLSSSSAWNNYGTSWSITIDGTYNSGTSTWDTRNTTDWIWIGYASKIVTHNTDGSRTVPISASHTGNSSSGMNSASGSGTLTLTTIPRYTTVYNSLRSKGLNNISINWSTTDARDWTQYSLNGGSWQDAYDTVASDQKSGYYTISNLAPNTTYTIKTQCRRTDSGLWSEAGSLSITTYDIARITNANNFDLGANLTVSYSNPSGANIEIGLYDLDGKVGYAPYRDCSGNSYTFNFTDSELDSIYKALETTNYGMFKLYLRTANVSSYTDIKDIRITLTGNQKTIRRNVSNAWKRGKLWTNVNGTWKRGVLWTNVGGTWKRGI